MHKLQVKAGLTEDSAALKFKALYESHFGFEVKRERWLNEGGRGFREILEVFVRDNSPYGTRLSFQPGEIIFDCGQTPPGIIPASIEPPE